MNNKIQISAIWLVNLGKNVEVRVEIERDGVKQWVTAITELYDTAFSHIAEANGAPRRKIWVPNDQIDEQGTS
jgi:hypothetical protein